MMLGAFFSQLYSLLADGTARPMVWVALGGALLTFITGMIPEYMNRCARLRAQAGPVQG